MEYLDIWRLDEPEEIDIFSNIWGNLTSLIIQSYPDVYNILCELCDKLEILEMRDFGDPNKEGIGYFPKLKHLYIEYIAEEDDNVGLHVSILSDKYNNQLESLIFNKGQVTTIEQAKRIADLKALKKIHCYTIDSSCIKYIASIRLEKLIISKMLIEDLLKFLRECKTLRWLLIGWIETQEPEFIDKLLNILEANGVQPDKPFVLEISRSFIKKNEIIMPQVNKSVF